MILIGIVGIGFMGMIHYLAAAKLRSARVTAIGTRNPRKREGDWRSIRGNFGPAGTRMDLGDVKRYAHFEEMCADPSLDLIDICTPTYLHADMAQAALRAGKHVLVEKAIALTRKDADAMLQTAAKGGTLVWFPCVLLFVPESASPLKMIRGGVHGRVTPPHSNPITAP